METETQKTADEDDVARNVSEVKLVDGKLKIKNNLFI